MVDANSAYSARRIFDVAANRAVEGLRAIEDFTRLHLNDRNLSEQLKTARHRLVEFWAAIQGGNGLQFRDILNDVGTTIETEQEFRRQGLIQIVLANFARLKQSLRSMEEYSKLLDPCISRQLEQLRYLSYSLEKAVINTFECRNRLADALFYVLVDGRRDEREFEALIKELLEAEVDVIQLRDENLSDRSLLARGEILNRLTASTPTIWIMNNRPDLAVLTNAGGVHVGQSDLSVAAVRKIVGAELLVGVSTHNYLQAQQAVLEGASYLGVGPMFPSATKSFAEFADADFACAVAKQITLPCFAIGGINESNLDQVLRMGFHRIALSAAVINAPHPSAAARNLKSRLVAAAKSI